MQLRTKVIGAAGIAAVVAAGGFAFTAGNTGATSAVAGYGTITATASPAVRQCGHK